MLTHSWALVLFSWAHSKAGASVFLLSVFFFSIFLSFGESLVSFPWFLLYYNDLVYILHGLCLPFFLKMGFYFKKWPESLQTLAGRSEDSEYFMKESPPKLSITYLWFFSSFDAVLPAARQWGPVDLQGKKTRKHLQCVPNPRICPETRVEEGRAPGPGLPSWQRPCQANEKQSKMKMSFPV